MQLALSDASLRTSSFTLSADHWSLKQVVTGKLLTAADVNQDERIDLVLTVGDSTHVEFGKGAGSYELSANSFGTALLAADLDADGLLDLEIRRSDGLYPLRGLGDGTFAEGAPLHLVDRFENAALVQTVNGSELLYGAAPWSVVSSSCLAR